MDPRFTIVILALDVLTCGCAFVDVDPSNPVVTDTATSDAAVPRAAMDPVQRAGICGDGTCVASETCLTCPRDCGYCPSCGNGFCDSTENSSNCPQDCGNSSSCGDGTCQSGENCTNCPQDCGQCTNLSCSLAFTCALKCISFQQNPPSVSVSCVANCLAGGCPDTQYFFDQAFNCAVQQALGSCGADYNCIQQACATEIAACAGSTCP